MAGVFIGDRSTRLMTWLACVAMAVAFVMVLALPDERTTTFFGLFVVDRFAAFMKCLVLVAQRSRSSSESATCGARE